MGRILAFFMYFLAHQTLLRTFLLSRDKGELVCPSNTTSLFRSLETQEKARMLSSSSSLKAIKT